MSLLAIDYKRGQLKILNQLLLPEESVYEEISSVEDGWQAIRTMKVSTHLNRCYRVYTWLAVKSAAVWCYRVAYHLALHYLNTLLCATNPSRCARKLLSIKL